MQMKRRTKLSTRTDYPTAVKLELDKKLQPCPAEPGDELFPNGIFEFNITQLLSFIEANVDRFPIERVGIATFRTSEARDWTKTTSRQRTCYGRFSWRRFRPDDSI